MAGHVHRVSDSTLVTKMLGMRLCNHDDADAQTELS